MVCKWFFSGFKLMTYSSILKLFNNCKTLQFYIYTIVYFAVSSSLLLSFCFSLLNNALLCFESKEPWILTTMLLIFHVLCNTIQLYWSRNQCIVLILEYFMFQFHTADILGKELWREWWKLKCASPLKLGLNHESEPSPNTLNKMA